MIKIRYNNPSKVLPMLTTLDSYVKFQKKVGHFINLNDTCVPEIYEMDRDIEKILEVARIHKVPGLNPVEQTIHALLFSTMSNAKANRANYQALRAIIDALNQSINLSYYS